MKFVDLLKTSPKDKVILDNLSKIFPEQVQNLEGYEILLKRLRELEPSNPPDDGVDDMQISLEYVYPTSLDENGYISVHGISEKSEDTYALELSYHEEWLGYEVSEKTLKDYPPKEIISRCMYEMTFWGWDNEGIKKMKDDLDSRIKSIDDGTAELIPWEEVRDRMFDSFDEGDED